IETVSIRNIANIPHLEFSPGPLTVISGENGAGKSSVVGAVSAALKGGSTSGMLRRGSSKGEVVLTLDRDGVPVVVTRRFTKKGSPLEVTEGGVPVSGPQGYLNEIIDAVVSNPDAFKQATPKEQVRMLLQASGVEVPLVEIATITGEPCVASGSAAEVIEQWRERIYHARTLENRAAKEHGATVTSLEASLLPEVGDVTEQAAALTQKAVDLAAEAEARREAARNKRNEAVDEVNRVLSAELQAIGDEVKPLLEEGLLELERLQAAKTAFDKAEGTRSVMEESRTKWDAAESRSIKMDRQLEQLEELRARVLGEIDIPGIDIADGEIRLNGIPFSSLSDSEKTKVAVNVARMRQAEAPVMFLDRMEILDDRNWESFCAHAAEHGIQVFAARRTDGPLKVEPNGKA
ncbi:hypothetical protein LCGC14_1753430, partial [marine sediment metagenome]